MQRRPQSRRYRRHRGVRAQDPRRSRDLFTADLGRGAHPSHAQEAMGAARRHPSVGSHQQAAIPAALLFLHRQCSRDRCVRSPDCGLGHRDEMVIRQNSRNAGADLSCAGDATGCARHQARKQGPGVFQAAALWLQQRAHRSLQVSLYLRGVH